MMFSNGGENELSISDDGKWYTVRYLLFDELESRKDTTRDKETSKIVSEYFTEDNKTNVLYIGNGESGIKYRIPDASNPSFSSASDWIAYKIELHPDSVEDGGDSVFIELKHLESGFTVQYASSAEYLFAEEKNYFITADEQSLLIYDLENRSEYFIGNVGEFLVDRKSEQIAYTISSEDRRGNGIYLYDPTKRTTKTLQTGNYNYSNLAWNQDRNAIAVYRYQMKGEKVDHESIQIVILKDLDQDAPKVSEYSLNDIEGLKDNIAPDVKAKSSSNEIVWSNDDKRLFIKVKEYEASKKDDSKADKSNESTVQVWHWKDEKLLSERIMEYDDKKDENHHAIFFMDSKKIVQISGEEIQNIIRSEGTDEWAIGTDNRGYVSDWDVYSNDLYRINLKTGEKNLIQKAYKSWYNTGIDISPDGKKGIAMGWTTLFLL